jgi:hypothetical protein
MPVTATPVFIQTPKITPQSFVQPTDAAGTYKTIFTAGPNGSKVVSIMVNTTDNTATHLLVLVLQRGGVNYTLIYYTLPVNAGGDGTTPSVDLLAGGTANLFVGLPFDNDGQRYLFLEPGDSLQLNYNTALTASKSIYVNTIGAHF